MSVLQILPGKWDVEAEDDHAKNVLLWVSDCLECELMMFTRIVLGVQVTTAAVTLPNKIVIKPSFAQSLLVLLGPVMLSAVLIGAGFVKA